ncbi:hypothetical protein QO200_15735 [Flavobacterium sp. Arc3]|jgi:quercetin dioxygenase-like cupin family protein|uniref:hypothetical protein n=1 Tax=Flavobacterium sp. Arc3 TaxID=3046686 RepID=UPI00352DD535
MNFKITIAALALTAILTSNTVNALVKTIDSVATSKVQHFNFDKMKLETIGEGIQRKWFHGEKGQMTIFNLEKGAHMPWHKHPN